MGKGEIRAEPLARHAAVDTRRPDEAREAIGRIFCPHFLALGRGGAERFHARHNVARRKGYSVNFVAYGAAVDIDPGELSGFFLLQVPLAGAARVRCGTRIAEVEADRTASLLSPTLPTRMHWQEGCEKLILLIDRSVMEAQAAALADGPVDRVEFETAVGLCSSAGQALSAHARLLLSVADAEGPVPEAYDVTLRDGLALLLLSAFPHSAAERLGAPVRAGGPATLRRAEAFLRENAHRPIAMTDVASAAGISLRSLQDGFRRHRGRGIHEMLQEARLERLRRSLLAADETATVAELTLAAGLGHLGRAAGAYRERYGETPSQTLRRRR